jgi:hypothetical protein
MELISTAPPQTLAMPRNSMIRKGMLLKTARHSRFVAAKNCCQEARRPNVCATFGSVNGLRSCGPAATSASAALARFDCFLALRVPVVNSNLTYAKARMASAMAIQSRRFQTNTPPTGRSLVFLSNTVQ